MAGFARAPFKVGAKEVFLPNFTVTLLRNDRLGPMFASFIVPLEMNKLDMRDYLWHAYNVRAVNIRSFVYQKKVQQGKEGTLRPKANHWYRPKSSKKMTVEMDSPFVWPEEPEDYAEWNKETYAQAEKDNEEFQKRRGRLGDTIFSKEDRVAMREQAQRLLEGKERWRSGKEARA